MLALMSSDTPNHKTLNFGKKKHICNNGNICFLDHYHNLVINRLFCTKCKFFFLGVLELIKTKIFVQSLLKSVHKQKNSVKKTVFQSQNF